MDSPIKSFDASNQDRIEKLIVNKAALNEMKTKIKSFAWEHADEVIASEIINEIDPKQRS